MPEHRSYAAYLKSPHWRDLKRRYRESDLPQVCVLCGHDRVDLHHRTYERLGRERLADLVPLCRRCHTMIHVLERRGDGTLDPASLMSAVRAAEYAARRRPVEQPESTLGQQLDAAIAQADRLGIDITSHLASIEKRIRRLENYIRHELGRRAKQN